MHKIVPYCGAYRIIDGDGRDVVQHGSRKKAEEALARLNRRAAKPKQKPASLADAMGGQEKAEEALEAIADGEPDLSVLDLTLAEMAGALATGDHDTYLDALLAAEELGKTRKGAVTLIKARIELTA